MRSDDHSLARERLPFARVRTLVVFAAVLPVICWGFWRSIGSVPPASLADGAPIGISRFQPMRELLQGVTRADLLAVSTRPQGAAHAFWHAQYALAPTVLLALRDPRQAVRRSRRVDPHVLVVMLPDHDDFLRFGRRYARAVAGEGGHLRVHDLGDGVGLFVSRRGR